MCGRYYNNHGGVMITSISLFGSTENVRIECAAS